MQRFTRIRCNVVFAALGLTGWLAAQAMTSGITFNISAGSATSTLKQFASQAHVQLLFDYKAVQNLKTPAVKGQLTPMEALKEMLEGSGFTFREINDHTIAVMAPGASTSSTGSQDQSAPGTDATKEGRDQSSGTFRVAQATPGQTSGPPSVAARTPSTSQQQPLVLQEVIVTAQKREERLEDVPAPVTAISADALVASDKLRLQDYYATVPGLSLSNGLLGTAVVSIRGVAASSSTNPTVAVTVDDLPFGSSTSLGGAILAPDFDPNDLQRVEVLRGPQGTLYGAGSLGGLIKYVTLDPSTEAVSGRVEAGTSSVYNGAELGYGARAAANVPLSDTVAVRASGFARQTPGYIDNIQTGEEGVNRLRAYGGRFSAGWLPSADFSLKLSAMLQDNRTDGSNFVYQGLGDLQQDALRGTGRLNIKEQVYDATVKAKLGTVDLTSITGYSINHVEDPIDFTPFLGQLVTQPLFGVTGTKFLYTNNTDKFTQEVRLSVPIGERLEWLIGGFYTYEKSSLEQTTQAVDPTTGAVVGELEDFTAAYTYTEYAAFTDLTYRFTDRFDVQVGGRESENRQTYSQTDMGPIAGPAVPKTDTKANSFTYLVTPRLRISSDLMVYARLASGYRPGGPNPNSATLGVPPTFAPDKTQNYEIGFKGSAFDRVLTFDASIYYIDWKDLQLALFQNGNGYYGNGSRAKSEGVEFSVETKPLTGLTISAWVAFDNAVLTEPFPPSSQVYGASGDRLPLSSRFSGSLSLNQDFIITSKVTAFVGGTASYVGNRLGLFTSPPPAVPPRQAFPGYAQFDLCGGLKMGSWTANAYLNNIADKRGVLSGGLGDYFPFAFTYIQPRTVGVSIAKTF